MNYAKQMFVGLLALLVCVPLGYAQKKLPTVKQMKTVPNRAVNNSNALKNVEKAIKGRVDKIGQIRQSVTVSPKADVRSKAQLPESINNGPLKKESFPKADKTPLAANKNTLKKSTNEKLADTYARMRVNQGIPEAQFRQDMEEFLFAESDLKLAQEDAKKAGLPVPKKNTPAPKKGIQMLRPKVLDMAGAGGVEHEVAPEDLAAYQTAVENSSKPYRDAMQEMYGWGRNISGTYPSALGFVEKHIGLWIPASANHPAPHFIHRETGIIGFVVEVPSGVVINDGVHAAQALDPQKHVIFYASDPAARVMAFVEERANLANPHKYNMLFPRTFEWMAAEQPIPANAGQTLIDRTEIEQTVDSYVQKYYR